jgi:ketosteroid isomerase-like protein
MDKSRHPAARSLSFAAASLLAFNVMIGPLSAAPEDDVRATFEGFVAAQNEHDIKAVEALLLDSPDFLWITRGTPIWGIDAAVERFATLYEGTWHLDPDIANLKVMMLDEDVAELFVPILFTIAPAGQSAEPTRFLMNQILVKTAEGWKVSAILPIPAPAE